MKAKKRTISTIIAMTLFAILVIGVYYYLSTRTQPLIKTDEDDLSEVEVLLNKNLEQYYPETPREVVKLYSSMMKLFYTDIEDTQLEALALKIRELYDQELLDENPEEEYLDNLYAEIASWNKAGRTITNFIFSKAMKDEKSDVDGKEYAVVYITYTVQEDGKTTQLWKFLLRRNDDKKWKILGWDHVS